MPTQSLAGRSSPVAFPESISVTAAPTVSQGDCIPVFLRVNFPVTHATVTLRSIDGRNHAQVQAWAVQEGSFVAPVPIDIRFEPGEYELEVTVTLGLLGITRYLPVQIQEKKFLQEDIYLDAKNAAVRSNTSKKRMEQIHTLNELLSTENPTATRYPGPFTSPLSGEPVRRTSFFGDNRMYRYPSGRTDISFHYGIDYGVPKGTAVFSVADGTVVMAEERISTGYTLVIEHFPGVYSLYYHLDTLLALTGETVRAGSLIARSGNTGLSTGPHLHLEFRVHSIAVSPDWFFGNKLW